MHSLLRLPTLLCCAAVLAAADDATAPVPVATWASGSGVIAVAIAKPGATVAAGDYLMSASGTVHLKLIRSPHSTVDLAANSEAYFEEKPVGDGTDLLIYLRKGSVDANIDAAPYRAVHVLGRFINASATDGYLTVTREANDERAAVALGTAHVDVSDSLAITLGHPKGADLGVRDEVVGSATGLGPVGHLGTPVAAAPAVAVAPAPVAPAPAPAPAPVATAPAAPAPAPVATAPAAPAPAPVATAAPTPEAPPAPAPAAPAEPAPTAPAAPAAPTAPVATAAPAPAPAPAAPAPADQDDGTPKLDVDFANAASGEISHETTTMLSTEVQHHINQGVAKSH